MDRQSSTVGEPSSGAARQSPLELRASLQRQARAGRPSDDAVPDELPETTDTATSGAPQSAGAVDAATTEVNPSITVWARENRLTSDGKTRKSALKQTVTIGDDGIRTAMVHVSGLSVIASVRGNKPFAEGESVITQDAFDQSQALAIAEEFLKRIASYDIDLKKLYRDRDANDGVLRFLVNQTSEGNADYAPGANAYIFGTDEGGFHLASCGDIIVHELGHGFVDHVAPGLTADEKGEGRSFHESMGDLFAAMFFGNPNISEDFAAYLAARHKTTPEAAKALRCLANEAELSPKVKEEHKRSLVYSGMIWSVTEKLAARIGETKAHDAMFGVLVKVPFVLTAKSPSPLEVTKAFADAIHATMPADKADAVLADLHAEAVKRKVIDAKDDLSASTDSKPAAQLREALEPNKRKMSLVAADTIVQSVAALPMFAERGDLQLEILGDRVAGSLRRLTLRARVADPRSHGTLAVEDGLVDLVFDRRGLRSVSGSAFSLPKRFELSTDAADFATAKKHLARFFESKAPSDAAAAAVYRAFDTLFDEDNVRVERVVSGGRVCLEVRTMAGDLIVDPTNGAVKIRRLLHVESGL